MSETLIVPRVPAAEKAALEDLLQSDGWALFEQAIRKRWGPDQYEAELRAVSIEARSTGADMLSVIEQINATYDGMRQMLNWPKQQIEMLAKAPARRVADVFAPFRRVKQ